MIPTITFVITCITAVISFVTLTVKLTRYITKAESKIDANSDELRSFEAGAVKEHDEMWNAIDKNETRINEHDVWIARHDAREEREKGDLK